MTLWIIRVFIDLIREVLTFPIWVPSVSITNRLRNTLIIIINSASNADTAIDLVMFLLPSTTWPIILATTIEYRLETFGASLGTLTALPLEEWRRLRRVLIQLVWSSGYEACPVQRAYQRRDKIELFLTNWKPMVCWFFQVIIQSG